MKWDIFFSICQTPVDGSVPDEKTMWRNFFSQLDLADNLGFDTAWVAETHLSCQTQKKTSHAVVPEFQGEIGLNTDILQLAHKIFSRTKNLNVGSAIRNILCNGGPVAHAEAVKTFLSLHGLDESEKRKLHIGFASGRFEFSNRPYGIKPRNSLELSLWPVLKGQILAQATEIFLRCLKSEEISSEMVGPMILKKSHFRSPEDWEKALESRNQFVEVNSGETPISDDAIFVPSFYDFEVLKTIPLEAPLHLLELTVGSHDPNIQILANQFFPVGVFNLSITPSKVIDETHERMTEHFHPEGGGWQRWKMPRTTLVFVDDTPGVDEDEKNRRAQEKARRAWENYWKAMEGTIDKGKVENATNNCMAGSPKKLIELFREKYHPQDRLMLWFDFNNHNNEDVKKSMQVFMEKVAPSLP